MALAAVYEILLKPFSNALMIIMNHYIVTLFLILFPLPAEIFQLAYDVFFFFVLFSSFSNNMVGGALTTIMVLLMFKKQLLSVLRYALFIFGFLCHISAWAVSASLKLMRNVFFLAWVAIVTPEPWIDFLVGKPWTALCAAGYVLCEIFMLMTIAVGIDLSYLSYFLMFGVWPTMSQWFRTAQRRPTLRSRATRRMFFQNTKIVVTKVSKVRLHEIVQSAYHAPTLESINKGLEIMKNLGFPVNDHVSRSDAPFSLGKTRFRSGVVRGSTFVSEALNEMRRNYETSVFVYTGTYASVKNEFESVARYFHGDNKEWDPTNLVKDMWFLCAPLYENAVLTPTRVVIDHWVKKYALGFGMVDDAGRKIKRSTFLRQVGYKKFRSMWDSLAQNFGRIVPVSHVSVKLEYLKPAKYLLDQVRAICGAPLSHYAATRNIRFEQNHRSAPDTGIVVGMPLTGYYFGKLAAKHLMMDIHVAGDFSKFDSTLNQKLNQLEAELCKMGFKGHDQFDQICTIIDLHTKQLDSMPLWTQSTGEVYEKPSGLTTGHGETTRKNSVALQALYLTAWKDLTGLSAHEFKRYNVLSNFGDDHILSYSSDAPAAWTFANVQRVLSRYGVDLREESSGSFYNLEFLSKCFIKPTDSDRHELHRLGLAPEVLVIHNREKLLGKVLADPKSGDPSYLLKRYHGYLQLCAHHPDVYEDLVKLIKKIHVQFPNTEKKRIPSYDQILKQWYNPSYRLQKIEDEGDFEHEALLRTVAPSYIGIWFDFLSGSLDLLNYRMMAFGPARIFQKSLRPFLAWAPQLIKDRNPEVTSVASLEKFMSKTPYGFLDGDIFYDYYDPTDKVDIRARHHLFMLYYFVRGARKEKVGWLDLVNVLTKRFGDINFLANGRVMDFVLPKDLQVIDHLVLAALGHVSVPFWLMADFQLLSPAYILDRALYKLRGRVINSVPSCYDDLTPWLGDSTRCSLLFSMDTGTGKSTKMIDWLADTSPFDKVIVVEPRRLLASSLQSFVSSISNHKVSAAYDGFQTDKTAKIIYTTSQCLFTRGLINDSYLYVIDEAHFSEPIYEQVKKFCLRRQLKTIFATATPPRSLSHIESLGLMATRPWQLQSTQTQTSCLKDYCKKVVAHVNNLPPGKVLVFIPTVKMAQLISAQVTRKSCIISSRNIQIDHSADCFISTKVSDAGLTIPDVETVITSDADLTVLDGKPVFYHVDDLTITQRVGRTGRTCDGDVFIHRIEGVKDAPPYPVLDRVANYAAALGSMVFVENLAKEDSECYAFMCNSGHLNPETNLLTESGSKYVEGLFDKKSLEV